MSRNELVAKIEALNEWEAVIEEAKPFPAAVFPSAYEKRPLRESPTKAPRKRPHPRRTPERARDIIACPLLKSKRKRSFQK